MAREIQESLLPQALPNFPCYEIVARWRSARLVAGDFYDLFVLGPDRFGLVIADVSDKGAPAALFMAVARSMIRTHAFSGLSPRDTLWRTNELILEDARSGMFVTVYYTVFTDKGVSTHVNAGHNPPLLYRAATGDVRYMARGGRAVGWFPDNPVTASNLALAIGDVLVFYTDGLTEAENGQGDFYGEERLAQAVHESAGQTAEAILDHIVASVDAFCAGLPALDDLTLCVVRFIGQGATAG